MRVVKLQMETDQAKILMLEDKYMKEFASKKKHWNAIIIQDCHQSEKNIKSEITRKAQKDGYDYVFAKSVVLFGGKDITGELLNNIK